MDNRTSSSETKPQLKRINWGKLAFLISFLALIYYSQDRQFADSEMFVSLIPLTYLFSFFIRWFYSIFCKITRFRPKILVYLLITITLYFISKFTDKATSWFREIISSTSGIMLYSMYLLPFWGIFKSRKNITEKMEAHWFSSIILRIIKILFSWQAVSLLFALFWYSYFKKPYDLQETENLLTIISFFYFPLAIFSIIIRFFHKISHFYSVSLSIFGLLIFPFVFYFTSPAMTPNATFAHLYCFFFSLAAPLGIASIITFILSVPAFFRLILKKPQYFMFSFFLLLSLLYVFTVEYRQYGQLNGYQKFFCSYQKTKEINSPKVVRIIGSNSEGSGFFLFKNTVITNRHVVNGEDYPKIVLPTGEFLTPTKVELSTVYDIAFLTTDKPEPEYVIHMGNEPKLSSGEEVLSFGYALGSDIKGAPTILPIRFENNRNMSFDNTDYLQFSSAIVEGMSGGPVLDKCGDFVGINVMSTSGTSLVVSFDTLMSSLDSPTEEPEKIKLEPGATPEASVYAYYYLLNARDTKGCYGLLSESYKTRSSYEEWTARFPNVIGVDVFYVTEIKPNLVYVMVGMAEWVNGEQVRKLYEGTWETVKEGDSYHLKRSYIIELESYYDMKGPDYFLNPEVKK